MLLLNVCISHGEGSSCDFNPKYGIIYLMKNLTFILEGSVPSKKNSRRVFARGGRVVNIPSKKYAEWHKEASRQIDDLSLPKLNPPYEITLCFWMKDNRRADLDNKAASILDLLQDCGVIEDDRWQVLPSVNARAMGISRDAPRVKIELKSS